jgi:hypothetical protein
MKKDRNMTPRRRLPFVLLTSALLVLGACSSDRRSTPGSGGTSSEAAANFADQLLLTGYSVQNKDGHTEVELRWKALRKPSADYYAFVHVLDASGGMAFQLDHPLKNTAGSPTGSWGAGDSVSDRFLAVSQVNHTSGTYTLRVGVYVPSPMSVLQISETAFPQPTDGWKHQSILIEHVECK